MATFQAQVEGLTGISIGTSPTTAEFAEFLKDGVNDITNRCIQAKPQERLSFTRSSSESTSNGSLSNSDGDIISVVRESGTDADWRPCSQGSIALQSRYTDTNSLYFASKFNPKYVIGGDGAILVYPVPSSGGANSYKFYHVNSTPVGDATEDSLIHTHSTVNYFPKDKVYLVVIYAAIKSLQASLSAVDISTFSLIIVPPDLPTISTISYTSVVDTGIGSVSDVTVTGITFPTSDIPTYTPPTQTTSVSFNDFLESGSLNPFGDSDPGALSITAVPPDVPSVPSFTTPDVGTVTIGSLGTAPAYTAPVVTGDTQEITGTIVAGAQGTAADQLNFMHWYDVLADMIETEEDIELAQAQIGKISTYLQSYSQAMQNQLNIFNDANVEYQSTVQEAIQNAQIAAQESQQETNLLLQKEQQEYASTLQRYSAEVQEYQAEVGTEVQEYGQKLQRYQFEIGNVYTSWAKTESDNLQAFQLDIQNELNNFNMENADFQLKFQEVVQETAASNQVALQNMQKDLSRAQADAQSDSARRLQDSIQDMQANIADNASIIQKYQVEISEYQAEVATEIQTYQQEIAEKGPEYQWKTARLQDLKQEYNQAFVFMAPPQPQQQQQARSRAR